MSPASGPVPAARPLTILLIVVSCTVAVLTHFGENWTDDRVSQKLVIAEYRSGGCLHPLVGAGQVLDRSSAAGTAALSILATDHADLPALAARCTSS